MNKYIKKILNKLGIIDLCSFCNEIMDFDQERFNAGYSARWVCGKCGCYHE